MRRYGTAFLKKHGNAVSPRQVSVLESLAKCRTPALGGHLYLCDNCHQYCISCNSCRDRHCPTCRAHLAAEWADAREAEMLPVGYFFATFTLPHALNALALANQKTLYGALFKAASETLLTIAADPSRMGAQIGFFAVLHTWGQQLEFHPHLHVVIPGGGLSPDGDRWIRARPKYLLTTKVLSKRFRTIFTQLLRTAHAEGVLAFPGQNLEHLAEKRVFNKFLNSLWKKDWVVDMQPPARNPSRLIRYLARYTHRVAISNHRLISIDDDRVTFSYWDYADKQHKVLTLSATEFIRRFLLHVLPKAFVRIRYYGFMANCHRKEKLALCQRLIAETQPSRQLPPPAEASPEPPHTTTKETLERKCPFCSTGHLQFIRELEPNELIPDVVAQTSAPNTS